jgi:hypothetical protein
LNSTVKIENTAPYAMFGDQSGNFNIWTPAPGTYKLTVTSYSGSNASGTAGSPMVIDFKVVSGTGSTASMNTEVFLVEDPAFAFQTFPNPVVDKGTISFVPKEDDQVSINIYDIHGNKVEEVFSGRVKKGETYAFNFETTDDREQIYIGRVSGKYHSSSKKIIVKR